MPIPYDYLSLLRCPLCYGEEIQSYKNDLICTYCEQLWPIRDGIVDFLLTEQGINTNSADQAYDDVWGRFYAMYMDYFWLQAVDSWLLGLNIQRYRQWIRQRLMDVAMGPVLEVPIGGAPFLDECPQYRQFPWIGVDLSWTMLRHVQRKCIKRGITSILLLHADARRLPIRTDAVRHVVSLFGLHCFHNKAAVLNEFKRSLDMSGHLVVSSLVLGQSKMADNYYRFYERSGTFTTDSTVTQLTQAIGTAGFKSLHQECLGAAWLLDAVRKE